ncbi:hypothetical protein RB628_41150, partial [Streptomyces sp. ADMS]|uniref:hypothetical protein n=1 Tax=Streptomyces sp. ADMS TaxID=3071415 RepID=UPI00296EB7DF
MDIRPLVSDGHKQRIGQISVEDRKELREFEQRFKSYLGMRRLVHRVPAGSGDQEAETEEIAPDPAVYVYAGHGNPGRLMLALRDGRTVRLGKQDAARYVAGLREVRQLPKGHRLDLAVCFSASDGDPHQQPPGHAPLPHVDDPWADVPFGQYAANESRRETTSATRLTALSYTHRVMTAAVNGERGRRVTFL